MFADHHVLRVRAALLAQDGIDDVYASSAWQSVIVSYDAAKIDPAAIEKALTEAGYAPGQGTPVLAQNDDYYRDPSWDALGVRVTDTNEADLQMSGEFRRY
jgi:copper chaperone CopZ